MCVGIVSSIETIYCVRHHDICSLIKSLILIKVHIKYRCFNSLPFYLTRINPLFKEFSILTCLYPQKGGDIREYSEEK